MAGPPAATAQVEKRLKQREDTFDIHRYADEAATRATVEDRTVYGTVVVTPQGPELLTASAAGPAVAHSRPPPTARGSGRSMSWPLRDPAGAARRPGRDRAARRVRPGGRGRGRDRARVDEAAALGLSTLAVSGAVAGLATLVGTAGIMIAGAVVMLLGNRS